MIALVCAVLWAVVAQTSEALVPSSAKGDEASLTASPQPDVVLPSVSCPAAGECTAVGYYNDSLGSSQGLLLSESADAWGRGVEATLPANADANRGGGLSSVSCVSAGNCSAVGGYVDSSGSGQGLLLTEAGGTWGAGVEAILPANAGVNPNVNLSTAPYTGGQSVSCASAGYCSAVGEYTDSAGHQQGLLLTESDGVWGAGVEEILPANAGSNPAVFLTSVSCASAGNCEAVGTYVDSSGNQHGLLLTESGGTWEAGVEPTLPANAGLNSFASLSAVSCASPGNCSVVGQYLDSSGDGQGLLLTESGGAWATGVEATPPATNIDPSSVSCASAGDCSAVGSFGYTGMKGSSPHGLLVSESGGTWGNWVEAATPSGTASSLAVQLDSVSCASAGNCSAVGAEGLLLSQIEGTWGQGIEATAPPNGGSRPDVSLSSVSCASAGDCGAVGQYFDSSGNQQGLLLTESGGTWVAGVEATPPANAATPQPPLFALSRLRVSPKTFVLAGRRVTGRCVKQTATNHNHRRCIRPISLRVSYTLRSSVPDVTITVERLVPGRLVVGRCVRPTSENNGLKLCSRLVHVPGKITMPGAAGVNSFTFPIREISGKNLRPGFYKVVALPSAGDAIGAIHTAAFRVVASGPV